MLGDLLQVHIPFAGVAKLLPWREQEFEWRPSPVGEPCRMVKDHAGRNEFREGILVDEIIRKTVSVATAQPRPTCETRYSGGTSALVKNTWLNDAYPFICRSGRTSTP